VTVEIDPRLAQLAHDRLIDADNVTIVSGDVLASKHRFAPEVLAALEHAFADQAAAGGGRFLLVANLPYCVATPVISNLLALPRPFDAATVTVQREMGERMTAAAGSHAYNALSVWVGAVSWVRPRYLLPSTQAPPWGAAPDGRRKAVGRGTAASHAMPGSPRTGGRCSGRGHPAG
jgi:16S rRNA (adenine1518-N6/adenine1519-N6)-dimethyltransferase